jgi:hypothetical protein
MKNGGADIRLLPTQSIMQRETFTYGSGEVVLRSENLTIERALYLLGVAEDEIRDLMQ